MDNGNLATIIMAGLALSGVIATAIFGYLGNRRKTGVDANGIIGNNYSMLVNRLGRDIERIDKDRGEQRQAEQVLLSQIKVMNEAAQIKEARIVRLEQENEAQAKTIKLHEDRIQHLEKVCATHGISESEMRQPRRSH